MTSEGGNAPQLLQLTEGALLAELAILEFLLHQTIFLRLDNLYPVDPLLKDAKRLANLQRAQYHCEIISSKICVLSPSILRDA
jgi:hypothetical protein